MPVRPVDLVNVERVVMARIETVPKPSIAMPDRRPEVPLERYRERLRTTSEVMARHGLDHLVVYGDRERAADLHHLTGIDPRFEEGILVLARDGSATVLLGNENRGRGDVSELGLRVRLFQELSPQGQVRDQPTQLETILGEAGLDSGCQVGVVGGKSFSAGFVGDPERSLAVPSYLADALRNVVGADHVRNAQQLFVHPEVGLRSINTAHEIAEAEYASAISSLAVHRAAAAITVGERADRLADMLSDGGVQRSVHPMVNFGERTRLGVVSPIDQRVELGDAFQVAFGLKGSLTCRSGIVANGPEDLEPATAEFFEALTLNYFDTVVAWYRAVRIGATGGEVHAAADTVRDDSLFRFSLNPGHTLGYEEWLESPFSPGNSTPLRSGLLLQGDIIPEYDGPTVGANIEDGVALADEELRASLAETYPEAYDRIQQRRDYLAEAIGVQLDASVLPLSNTPLWHAPYVLDQSRALTV